jgi:hypothetical protein
MHVCRQAVAEQHVRTDAVNSRRVRTLDARAESLAPFFFLFFFSLARALV